MENESAFKNWINPEVVKKIANSIHDELPSFNKKEFLKVADELSNLELKGRVLIITKYIFTHLPQEYPEALKIIVKVMQKDKLKSFELWPFSEFISQFGLDHFEQSLNAMYILTQKFTAEFAVRTFFAKDHEKVLNYFLKLTHDKNHHVRRWVSEGSRPILPWGMKLNVFVTNPKLTIPLLNNLKYDKELYVRKSVANHLNDISKSHPLLVIQTLIKWEQHCPKSEIDKITWIKKHALRTLIKRGDKEALKLMGVKGATKISINNFKLNRKKFSLNDKINFEFEVKSLSNNKQTIIIDYLIYYIKTSGKLSPKVYKLKKIELKKNEKVKIQKNHSLKPITTMKFHKGIHQLKIQINGTIMKEQKWFFDVDSNL